MYCRPELVGAVEVLAQSALGQLTCQSGAAALGLDVWRGSPKPHVRTSANPRPARRDRTGVIVHPWGNAGSGSVTRIEALLHDCACCLPPEEAVVIVDSALRSKLIEESDWPQIIGAGPHPGKVERVLRLADPQSQSVLESIGRVSLCMAGIRDIRSQVWFSDVGWVDLVVDGWLVVELDGRSTHESTFQTDRTRDAELTRRGLVVLRFTYPDLRHRLGWFVDVVQETLDRGRPPFADLRRGPGW